MSDEWSEVEYGGCRKHYLNGIVTATISYAVTGEKGYIARIGNVSLKKRFEYMENAKEALDELVKNRCIDYLAKVE